jgi:hypothetical protein
VVLVTYTTRRGSAAAHRSSIWVRHENQWLVLYHQATPLEVAPADLSE